MQQTGGVQVARSAGAPAEASVGCVEAQGRANAPRCRRAPALDGGARTEAGTRSRRARSRARARREGRSTHASRGPRARPRWRGCAKRASSRSALRLRTSNLSHPTRFRSFFQPRRISPGRRHQSVGPYIQHSWKSAQPARGDTVPGGLRTSMKGPQPTASPRPSRDGTDQKRGSRVPITSAPRCPSTSTRNSTAGARRARGKGPSSGVRSARSSRRACVSECARLVRP